MPGFLHEELGERQAGNEEHVEAEDEAAANVIRDGAGNQCADEESGQCRGAKEPHPQRREPQGGGGRGDDDADDADDAENEAVTELTTGAGYGNAIVEPIERNIFIGRRDSEGKLDAPSSVCLPYSCSSGSVLSVADSGVMTCSLAWK